MITPTRSPPSRRRARATENAPRREPASRTVLKRDAASQRASDAERLVTTAADLARARTSSRRWTPRRSRDGVADAARSDASDHAATERCATRPGRFPHPGAIATTTTNADTTNAAMTRAARVARSPRRSRSGSRRSVPTGRARVARESRRGGGSGRRRLDPFGTSGWVGSIAERSSAETREEFFDCKLARSSTPHSRRLGKGEGGEGCAESARPIGCEVLTANADWFARAYGAWAALHANMGRELRDGKPASVPLARDGEDGTSSGDGGSRIGGIRASPWAESAAAAIDPAAAAATLGAPIPHDSRPSPLGADALFLPPSCWTGRPASSPTG